MSELMDHEIQRMIEKEEEYNRDKEKKEKMERVPDMQKVLADKNLKIMVKFSNINYDSVEDILEARRDKC